MFFFKKSVYKGIKTNSATLGFSGGSVSKGQCGSGVNPLPTIADHVKKLGKRVGVVTTARVTHATPAALYAKTEDRDWEGNSPDGCKGKLHKPVFEVFLRNVTQNFQNLQNLDNRKLSETKKADFFFKAFPTSLQNW